ncbi:hypothetical protein Taro_014419 [Colocasia esculenta]|uniref:Protein kinase domain-containing protein n=1 Tax=Colocasia esculenta TaxID=4460 RepID=A0A843UJ13_COLES|nr:hypothetical protein [Colocasia esculenta]
MVREVEQVLVNGNSLTGEIPWQLGEMASLMVLDLSKNALTGTIPSSLANVPNLQVLLLNHNHLSGSIPMSFSNLTQLTTLDVSFNNLSVSGHISNLRHLRDCSPFRGKTFLQPCSDPDATSQSEQELQYTKSDRDIYLGGFGSTYKAELLPGFLVAVKRLSIGRFQGLQQFDAEIRTLGRIRHKKTLLHFWGGDFIHDRSGKNACWSVIHKIALDVAQALAYTHYSCVPRIVSETHATTDGAGTFGYVAPAYSSTCRASDVYSFGVVLLELMSGKRYS